MVTSGLRDERLKCFLWRKNVWKRCNSSLTCKSSTVTGKCFSFPALCCCFFFFFVCLSGYSLATCELIYVLGLHIMQPSAHAACSGSLWECLTSAWPTSTPLWLTLRLFFSPSHGKRSSWRSARFFVFLCQSARRVLGCTSGEEMSERGSAPGASSWEGTRRFKNPRVLALLTLVSAMELSQAFSNTSNGLVSVRVRPCVL